VSKSTNFCPKCGKALNETKETAPQPQIALPSKPVQAIAPVEESTGKKIGSILSVFFGLVFLVLFVLIMTSTNDTTPNTNTTNNNSTTTSAETTGCSAGYCNSNGHCCPLSARYYCDGYCYKTSEAALSATNGSSSCTGYRIVCPN